MSFDGWFTLLVIAAMLVSLVREWLTPDIALFGALVFLWGAGIVETKDAIGGFANENVLTIAMLFVVSAAMRETGALAWITERMLGQEHAGKRLMARMLIPTAALSAFMNNTPIVAMFTPPVRDWAVRNDRAPSKFLIPLSFAAILGGTCTLIGTSTNLVVSGLLAEAGYEPIGMFELSAIGVPIAAIGLIYLMTIAPKLLPDRRAPDQKGSADAREYSVTVEVVGDGPLVGKTVDAAGLRSLAGLFLVEIERDGSRIAPVRPTDLLRGGDHLVLYGRVDSVAELTKAPGLRAVSDSGTAETRTAADRRLFEVVISSSSPLIGTTLRDARFRRRYDAAVIAIHRGGERLDGKLGGVSLRAGDTLMVEAAPGFRASWGLSRDFYLVAQLDNSETPRYHLAGIALTVMIAMVTVMALGIVDIVYAAAAAVCLLVFTGCVRISTARQSVDLSVVILIASAFGISAAVGNSGLGDGVAIVLTDVAGQMPPWVLLGLVYLLCSAFTEVLSNAAAAALIFPIALGVAEQLERDPRPYAVAVAIAASLSFITPLGRPTNLIVYGPGGYKFSDFPRVGVPLFVLCFIAAMALIPALWGQ